MTGGDLEFQHIYDAFRPKIYRYLARLTGADEADDLKVSLIDRCAELSEENLRLCREVETLKDELAGAHADNDVLQAALNTQLAELRKLRKALAI